MNQFKKVSFYTLGCKLNFSETSTIGRLFEDAGFAKVDFNDSPDVYVINTCSVTDNADKKCKQLVRKALSINSDAFIAIIGCYAQLKPKEIAAIPGVDLVLGANEKFNIIAHLDSLEKKEKAHIENKEIKHTNQFIPSFSIGERTRSFLKIQDGCDYFCSFCTIPLARGFSRSNTISSTIKTANEVADSGVKEIVLTGVNIGDFGVGTEENFLGLIKELDKISSIERF
jgi:threonylcarbamoyladenosine tRNA methylthiotransferase MtaB